MKAIKLAKACRRRVKGAPMVIADRAAYKMMVDGLAVKDRGFMQSFEEDHHLPKTQKARKKRATKKGKKK